ncbi:MarR family transcriptional regulator [Rhodobacterales bacterium HKCCE2091]|nr:MarR family transcriptional regulator [Rhodobacterales bacterium HKCCE2091]
MAIDRTTEAAWTTLVTTGRRLHDAVGARLKAAGLPPLDWYDALWEIEKAGEGGLRPLELESRLLLPQYGVSRLVDRLAKAGLVERRACPDDRRGQVLHLTAEGREMRATIWPVYEAALTDHIAARMPRQDRLRLVRLLQTLDPGDLSQT